MITSDFSSKGEYMAPPAPLIFISAAVADRPFLDGLSARLQLRGLYLTAGGELNPAVPPTEMGRAISQCTVCFVVVSAAGMASPTVRQEYQYALSLGRPVVPIIRAQRLALPPELQSLQWVDYRGSEADGWRSLLVALATLGIARFPVPQPPTLDAEVVLAQALAGRIPPSWSVYRRFARGARKVRASTLWAVGIMFTLTVAAAIVTQGDLFVLVPNVVAGITLFLRFSPRRLTQEKQGDLVIVTPEGVVIHQRTGDIACSFHDTATITQQTENLTGTTILTVMPMGGRAPYALVIDRAFTYSTAIAQQIIAFHRDYLVRSVPSQSATPPASPLAPLIFLSHARKDAVFVDTLELGLRQRGLNPWVDRTMLFGGQQWPAELQQAIERCAVLVVVLTPAAMASAAVQREYTYALQLGKPVIAVLAQTTRAIPPVLQSRIRADYRSSDIVGLMAVNVALDDLGIRPSLPPSGMLRLDPGLIVGRACQGWAPPGGHVYRGGIPRRMLAGLVYIAFFGLVVGPLLYLGTGSPVILFDDPILVIGIAVVFIENMWRKKQLPDLIITQPDGALTFLRGVPSELSYARLDNLTVRNGLFSSRVLFTPKGSRLRYVLRIRGHFTQHRQITDQIAADYQRYVASAAAPAAYPAVPMRR